MVDEIHELVELGRDDDLCAAVALFAHLSGVSSNRVVFTTATGSQTLGVNTILVLQGLYHA